ncbi:hypothetical protein [Bradyrhizobium sp. AUGA SZCCT0283]|uniref:hypothetical protein n=1 Tax=Bradyrhizobium sp. AUGA SZCCT0283 TaxID=2807671 RepID=UPI001BA8871D|nr:hypothetical protein [Bradyrhizobium sp. AUGA SZCCT0283]MBR1274275.1 hypothetical protein [Bradyrhizobium sp. AUGA SZCCT0283]
MAKKTGKKTKREKKATLTEAFGRIRSDRNLAMRFTQEPETILKELGVPTARLLIQKYPADRPPPPASARAGLTVCGSLGYIICVTVGDGGNGNGDPGPPMGPDPEPEPLEPEIP